MSKETGLTVVEKEFVWEQKFRPNKLSEIILPPRIKDKLQGYVDAGRLPCLLLYSPCPGTGKTTTAKALANEVGCKKPLFINASLNTDIATIRTKVVQYSSGASLAGGTKVVILDETERLSNAAQESLKGIIETVSKTCIFILTTNNVTRIVQPLVSRCRVVEYMWTAEETTQMSVAMIKRCIEILNAEEIPFESKVVVALVKKHFPDNRTILGTLQDFAQQHGEINEGILGQINSGSLDGLIKALKDQNFSDIKQWVTDNVDTLGVDFYAKLTHKLIDKTPDRAPLVKDESIPEVIDVLGEEQKFHGNADNWLHILRTISSGLAFNPSVKFR
ncbi:clamp loader of DNA polymerase [Vibrio phage D528]|nr:putative replication factor C small subunit [Vibrio phage 144E46.1]